MIEHEVFSLLICFKWRFCLLSVNTWNSSQVHLFLTGEKLGFSTMNAVVTNEEGAEVDCIEVIRDNDKLFFIEEENFARVYAKIYN